MHSICHCVRLTMYPLRKRSRCPESNVFPVNSLTSLFNVYIYPELTRDVVLIKTRLMLLWAQNLEGEANMWADYYKAVRYVLSFTIVTCMSTPHLTHVWNHTGIMARKNRSRSRIISYYVNKCPFTHIPFHVGT